MCLKFGRGRGRVTNPRFVPAPIAFDGAVAAQSRGFVIPFTIVDEQLLQQGMEFRLVVFDGNQ